MLVIQMLLPRFLVLEGLLLFYLLHKTRAISKEVPKARDISISSCSIDLNAWTVRNPPLFQSMATGQFILPTVGTQENKRILNFEEGQILVSCPGAKLKLQKKVSDELKCRNQNLESEKGHPVHLSDLSCSRSIREKVVETGEKCGPQEGEGRIIRIGWRGSLGNFWSQINVCHDDETANTYYSNHILQGSHINAKDKDSSRPSFKEGQSYDNVSAAKAYRLKSQKTTLKHILGPSRASEILNSRNSFLSKGHLSPDADFLLREFQDATYHFINVAPQWQAFNNGNWRAVEEAVRIYASRARSPIQVYTGTLGNLKYENDLGIPTPLFLAKEYRSNNKFSLIPVPEFMWKIVHNPISNSAIVFVGLNDPHFKGNPERTAQICPDTCAKSKWFFFYQNNVEKGFLYCCKYQDFKGLIDWVPDIGDPKVMENIIVL